VNWRSFACRSLSRRKRRQQPPRPRPRPPPDSYSRGFAVAAGRSVDNSDSAAT